MDRHLLRACLVAAVGGALASGCGDATPTGDDNARAAVATFLQTCAEGEGAAALETLTEPARDEFIAAPDARTGCARVLGAQGVAGEEELRRVGIVDADAHAGFARVSVELPSGERRQVELESVAGRWLLANPLRAP